MAAVGQYMGRARLLFVVTAHLATAAFLGKDHARPALQSTSEASADDAMPPVAWRAFEALAEEKRYKLVVGSSDSAAPAHPEVRGNVFEAVEIALPLQPPIIKHDPALGAGQGDKNIVGMNQMTRGGHHCIVYGMGIAHDPGFELQMSRAGCETHAFDCTVDPQDPVVAAKPFKFHPWCIGRRSNVTFTNNIYVHSQSDANKFQFKSLADTMAELGHNHVDLLKFDIEGFEWQLLETEILPSRNPPEQISFELHTQKANPAYVPPSLVSDKGYVEVNRLFRSLYDKGYRVASKELNSGDPACAEFVVLNVRRSAA